MKYSVKLILLAPVMFSFLLLSGIFAPQASAASHLTGETSVANLQSGSKVVPLASGGGCYNWGEVALAFTDRVCISEDKYHEIVADAYESTSAPGDFTYFTIEVDLLDATTGKWTYAVSHDIGYAHGHWSGPTIPAVAGHHYVTYTTWYAGNTIGTRFISQHADYSPTQIA